MKNKFNKSFPDPKNQEMCEWACNYLAQRLVGEERRFGEAHYAACRRLLAKIPTTAAHDLLLEDMKTAWRQRTHKIKQRDNGRKSCSFVLTMDCLEKLDWLAKENNSSIKDILEEIIKKAHKTQSRRKERVKFSTFKGGPPPKF